MGWTFNWDAGNKISFVIMVNGNVEGGLILHEKGKCKGKAVPLQAWTGPEGSRRLRLPDFKTIGT